MRKCVLKAHVDPCPANAPFSGPVDTLNCLFCCYWGPQAQPAIPMPSLRFIPPPPLLFFFLLPPATPQTCLRCSGRPCPFDDALRCWVIAQAAPSAWKGPMAPSPACLKPCPLPMPSKPPATPHPLGAVLTCSSRSPSQARDSACAHRARQEPYGYFLT